MVNKLLKPNVVAEPLIMDWYAWSHLIYPASAACNVDHQIKLMRSYIQAPLIHKKALEDPNMFGGPFINLKGQYVEKIKWLLDDTLLKLQDLISLGQDIKNLDNLLQERVTGDTLEEFYNQIPEKLRGMVEIVYDLNNHVSIRFLEHFIYQKFYNEKYQSVLLYTIEEDHDRSFIMSTPRVNKEQAIEIKIPFSRLEYDLLFALRTSPGNIHAIMDSLNLTHQERNLFESFTISAEVKDITTKEILPDHKARIRYFGHACVLLEALGESIIIDPIIPYIPANIGHKIDRYSFTDLPEKIDYILISHTHQDHFSLETLLQLRGKARNIVIPHNIKGALQDPSLKAILSNIGFSNIIYLDEGEKLVTPMGNVIIGFPFQGEHADLNIQSKLNYFIKIGEQKFFFAVDSNNIENKIYDYIYNEVGSVNFLFLGMECEGAPLSWVYGPLLSNKLKRVYDQNRRLSGSDSKKALDIVKRLYVEQVFIYAMGQEPWLRYIMSLNYNESSVQIIESNKLIDMANSLGIAAELLYGRKEWIIEI